MAGDGAAPALPVGGEVEPHLVARVGVTGVGGGLLGVLAVLVVRPRVLGPGAARLGVDMRPVGAVRQQPAHPQPYGGAVLGGLPRHHDVRPRGHLGTVVGDRVGADEGLRRGELVVAHHDRLPVGVGRTGAVGRVGGLVGVPDDRIGAVGGTAAQWEEAVPALAADDLDLARFDLHTHAAELGVAESLRQVAEVLQRGQAVHVRLVGAGAAEVLQEVGQALEIDALGAGRGLPVVVLRHTARRTRPAPRQQRCRDRDSRHSPHAHRAHTYPHRAGLH